MFSILDKSQLVALPAKCGLCGGATKQTYIDTGLQFEFYGAFIMCIECINDIANVLGYASQETTAAYREKLSELTNQNQSLAEQVVSLANVIEAMKRADFNDNPLGDILSNFDSLERADELARQETLQRLERGENTASEGEGSSSGSSDDQDLGELRSNSIFDFSID